MANGRSLRLYLADGSASGIVTVEIGNWSGHILFSPRTRIEAALARSEVSRTGVYILIGPDDEDQGQQKIYVGEADELKSRIASHNKEKDFWDRFISISSKDMNLTKAHVKYLEGRLLDFAHDSGKASIDNRTNPNFAKLPEADISDMESFLDEIKLALPVLGVDFFPTRKVSAKDPQTIFRPDAKNEKDVFFIINNSKAGIDARATEIDGEFVVLEGSTGSLKERSSFLSSGIKTLRDRLLKNGVAGNINDSNFILRKDVEFKSPSGASVFLHGTSRNGRTDWLVEGQGITYAEWKDREIAEAIGQVNEIET
ncbi:GIY-YIG nuclease family protein [Ahrensia sp. 13_GOM-1096m]|uniref:GIY-YIG nuclease family protein n=1 Tax=Ahrensia sp. 13_GOM-1096m TaxID=1380380 RepID=UPI00047CAE09|nr:GIY-YIG nuclease family protein [Ahrensia sp. 13_GOM-1096m]